MYSKIKSPQAVGRPICGRLRLSSSGFTAVELLVTIAILAVLAALAAPSFAQILEKWRIRQINEALQSSLYLARSEAIKRGGNVVVKKLPNNTNGCTTATTTNRWVCGWIICDTTVNSTCNPSGEILQRYDSPAPRKVEIARARGGETIQLDRWGAVSGTYAGFSITPTGGNTSSPSTLGVCMSSGGRIRTTDPANTPCSS